MAEPFPGFLDWLGQQIGNQAMSAQGYDPQAMRFYRQCASMRFYQSAYQSAQQAGGQATQLIPPGMDPQAMINAANMANAGNIGVQAAAGMVGAPEARGIIAYHGSPYQFDAFDASKIGNGEGAQWYGHGLYFAGNEGVAKYYRDALTLYREAVVYQTPYRDSRIDNSSRLEELYLANIFMDSGRDLDSAISTMQEDLKKSPNSGIVQNALRLAQTPGAQVVQKDYNLGYMYQVRINAEPEQFLDWDKPLSEQSPQVQQSIAPLVGSNRVPDAVTKLPSGRWALTMSGEVVGRQDGLWPNLGDGGMRKAAYRGG